MIKKKKFLDGHKKVGKKLIPPMLQIPNMVMTSFRDDRIPDLVWLAPFFLRMGDKVAVDTIIEFLVACQDTLSIDEAPPLVFLSNFNKLTAIQKQTLIEGLSQSPLLDLILRTLNHQNSLFKDYPLKFLFDDSDQDTDKEQWIMLLEKDVDALFNRHSHVATKIQVTAVVSMMATGKMYMSNEINMPDFNTIFINPDSEDAKHVASFARATLNGGLGFDNEVRATNLWLKSFWEQSFSFSRCT